MLSLDAKGKRASGGTNERLPLNKPMARASKGRAIIAATTPEVNQVNLQALFASLIACGGEGVLKMETSAWFSSRKCSLLFLDSQGISA